MGDEKMIEILSFHCVEEGLIDKIRLQVCEDGRVVWVTDY